MPSLRGSMFAGRVREPLDCGCWLEDIPTLMICLPALDYTAKYRDQAQLESEDALAKHGCRAAGMSPLFVGQIWERRDPEQTQGGMVTTVHSAVRSAAL